jgi:hypothetical protein
VGGAQAPDSVVERVLEGYRSQPPVGQGTCDELPDGSGGHRAWVRRSRSTAGAGVASTADTEANSDSVTIRCPPRVWACGRLADSRVRACYFHRDSRPVAAMASRRGEANTSALTGPAPPTAAGPAPSKTAEKSQTTHTAPGREPTGSPGPDPRRHHQGDPQLRRPSLLDRARALSRARRPAATPPSDGCGNSVRTDGSPMVASDMLVERMGSGLLDCCITPHSNGRRGGGLGPARVGTAREVANVIKL